MYDMLADRHLSTTSSSSVNRRRAAQFDAPPPSAALSSALPLGMWPCWASSWRVLVCNSLRRSGLWCPRCLQRRPPCVRGRLAAGGEVAEWEEGAECSMSRNESTMAHRFCIHVNCSAGVSLHLRPAIG